MTPTPQPRIAALVLAAGSSTRYGQDNKLLARLRGTSILSRVLQCLQRSVVDDVLLVTGHDAETVSALCDEHDRQSVRPTQRIHNEDHATGMASSLTRGVAELRDVGVDAILVCLGDMPAVSSAVVDTLVGAWHAQPGKALYIPTYSGKRGNPVIITASLFDAVMRLEGDVGARVLARHCPESVLEIACDCTGILLDVDQRTDLDALESASWCPENRGWSP